MNTKIQVDNRVLQFPEDLIENTQRKIPDSVFISINNRLTSRELVTNMLAELAAISFHVYDTYGKEKARRMFARIYAAIQNNWFLNQWYVLGYKKSDDSIVGCGCFYSIAYKLTSAGGNDLLEAASPYNTGANSRYLFNGPAVANKTILVDGEPLYLDLTGLLCTPEGSLLELLVAEYIYDRLPGILTPALSIIEAYLSLYRNTDDLIECINQAKDELCAAGAQSWYLGNLGNFEDFVNIEG